MGNIHNTPYASLGSALRAIRLREKESLLEVSEAIEISGERLALIENGELRPTEDILELMIAHYSIGDHEADKLWDLAGYKKQDESQQNMHMQAFMLGIIPQHILYTDSVQVSVNDYGITLNFMQQAVNGSQQVPIARIGMSKDHTKSMIALLEKALHEAVEEPKKLEPPQKHAE